MNIRFVQNTVPRVLITLLLLPSALLAAPPQPSEHPSPQAVARVADIQKALRAEELDGWLFYSFRELNPIAKRVLLLDDKRFQSRRWYYFVPAVGEPTKIVHSIERYHLDSLPGRKRIYLPWQQIHQFLSEAFRGVRQTIKDPNGQRPKRKLKIAMEYSPNNNIPYISRVDGGTVELIRSMGVEVLSSGDLVQQFEAVWSESQWQSHQAAAATLRSVVEEAFAEIARRIRAEGSTAEYAIQQFIHQRLRDKGLLVEDDQNVSVNANSANPHYSPTAAVHASIRRGDFVLIDIWAKQKTPDDAIYADITWTGYVGETVPEEYAKVFHIVREARDAAVEFVRKAVTEKRTIYGYEVDRVARSVVERAGFGNEFIHRTGHSIGREVHGNGTHIDSLETLDQRRILPNTGFSIEPGVYLQGKFGVRSEIDVFVRESEVRLTGQPIQTAIVPILKP